MKHRVSSGRLALIVLAGALAVTGRAAAQAPAAPFPDVPPWHWAYQGLARDAQAGILIGYPAPPAELVENAVTQVYDGFAHSHAPEARPWVERFTFNRPAAWPRPFERSALARFALTGMTPAITADAATVTFTAQITTRTGQTTAAPIRVVLRRANGDWQIDYATLAEGSALFR